MSLSVVYANDGTEKKNNSDTEKEDTKKDDVESPQPKKSVAIKFPKKNTNIAIPISSFRTEYYIEEDKENNTRENELIGFNFINYLYKKFKFAKDIF